MQKVNSVRLIFEGLLSCRKNVIYEMKENEINICIEIVDTLSKYVDLKL